MREIVENWDFKKHFAFIVSFYAILVSVINAVMLVSRWISARSEISRGGKWLKYIDKKTAGKAVAISHFKEPSKAVKLVNGVMGMCFLIDMSSYPLIKKMMKKI